MAWIKGEPVEGILAPNLNDVIRDNNDALEIALNKEMNFATGGVASLQGILKQGSARPFFQNTVPGTRVDGSAFASTDLGMFWIDSDSSPDNQLNILTATTPTWTPVSTEIIAVLLASARVFGSTLGVTGDFAVNTDKMTVDADNGNTLVGGTLDIQGTIPVVGVLDEDDLTSDSATNLATQQSIKKYVDNQTTTPTQIIKGWVTFDESANILDSFNVTSVTRQSTGNFTVTWATDFADANYACVVTGDGSRMSSIDSRTAGTVLLDFRNSSGDNVNPTIGNVIAIGDQE